MVTQEKIAWKKLTHASKTLVYMEAPVHLVTKTIFYAAALSGTSESSVNTNETRSIYYTSADMMSMIMFDYLCLKKI